MVRTIQNSTHNTTVPQRIYKKRGKRGRGRKKKKTRQLNTGIFNLTGLNFSEEELKVLAQGLKFAPDKNVNKFELFVDIEKYIGKLNNKNKFASLSNISQPPLVDCIHQHSGLRNNSVFNPKILRCLKTWYKMR